MRASERKAAIIDYIKMNGHVESSDLAEKFNVSIMTIRRDFAKLEEEGLILCEYGGAVLNTGSLYEHTMVVKAEENYKQKEDIAKYCASLIKEGDSIFLDAGTTVNELAKLIRNRRDITIITNSLLVANTLANSDVDLLMCPGKYRPMSMAYMGQLTDQFVETFQFDKVFLAVEGVKENGIYVPDLQDCLTKRTLIKRAKYVYCMADSSKLGKEFHCRIEELSKIDIVVTNKDANKNMVKKFKTKVHIV